MKNKIIIATLSIMLFLPALAIQEENVDSDTYKTTENIMEETEETLPKTEDVSQVEDAALQDTLKKPISKKKIAKKFLLAMFGVLVSSLIIFAGLSIYNSVRKIATPNKESRNEEPSSLEVPDNLNDAIKSFFDRTHWDT